MIIVLTQSPNMTRRRQIQRNTQVYTQSILSNLTFGGARYITTGYCLAMARNYFSVLFSRFADHLLGNEDSDRVALCKVDVVDALLDLLLDLFLHFASRRSGSIPIYSSSRTSSSTIGMFFLSTPLTLAKFLYLVNSCDGFS